MIFNSLSYVLFLPLVYLVFRCTAKRWRWLVLLVASYGFYAAFKVPYLLAVLLMVTGISYMCALRIAAQRDEASRKRWLWIGNFSCVAILALLKYLPFIKAEANSIFGLNSTSSSAIISIGVSFFTFQSISYLTDVYLETEEPEHHFGYYALYLAFFPKLIQGPIERADDLLPQLKKPFTFDYDNTRIGLVTIAWGLFKKVVIADRMGIFVNAVYNDVHSYHGISLLLATYYFAIQLYCDFSGYTDMALGTARIFNINLTQNFNSPYLAESVAEFWRRWHISFSRWIFDYIFRPLQMRWRNWGVWGTSCGLIITFLVSGIWHGASWGYVIWGLLHGTYLAVSIFTRPKLLKLYKYLRIEKTIFLKLIRIVITFNLICFAWVFFRANSINDIFYILNNIFDLSTFVGLDNQLITIATFGQSIPDFMVLVLSLTLMILVGLFKDRFRLFDKGIIVRWAIYLVLVSWIILLYYDSKDSFLYAKF